MIAVPVIDLPAPDSPTTPSTSPGANVEAHVVDGRERAPARVELHAQVPHLEQRRGGSRHRAAFPEST